MLSERVQALEPSIIRQMSGRASPSTINLTLGEPAIPPDPKVLDAAVARLRAGPQGYTPNAGLTSLRAAIASHYALEGRATAESVIVTVGSEEAVFLAMLSTLNPGDEVLYPEPGYPAYKGIARLVGAVPVPYAVGKETGLRPGLASIEAALTARTKVLLLNGPSNPFGQVDTPEGLEEIAELANRRGLTVITDEIYRELYYEGAPPSIASMAENVIFISGLSKCCATTGLRVGYLIAKPNFIAQATLCHQLLVTCAPRLAQLVAEEIFLQPERLGAHRPYYREARAALLEARTLLPDSTTLHVGEGAFYGVLDVAALTDDPLKLALDLLKEQDVAVVPGTAFGQGGSWFWRLSYSCGADQIQTGIQRIAAFITQRPLL